MYVRVRGLSHSLNVCSLNGLSVRVRIRFLSPVSGLPDPKFREGRVRDTLFHKPMLFHEFARCCYGTCGADDDSDDDDGDDDESHEHACNVYLHACLYVCICMRCSADVVRLRMGNTYIHSCIHTHVRTHVLTHARTYIT